MSVTAFQDLPLADRDREWDAVLCGVATLGSFLAAAGEH